MAEHSKGNNKGFTRDVFDLHRAEKHDGILTQHLRSDEHAATTAFDEAVATHQSLGELGSKISHEKQSLDHLGSSNWKKSPAYGSAAGKLNTDEISEDKAADQEQAFDRKALELGHRSSHLRSDLRHEAKTLLHDESRLTGDVSPKGQVTDKAAGSSKPATVQHGVVGGGSRPTTVEGFRRDVFDLQRAEKHDGILTQHLRSDEQAAATAFDEAVATHQSLGELGSKISHEKQSLNHLGSSDGIDSPAYKSAADKLNTDEVSEDKAADQEQAFDHKASELGHRSSHLRSNLRHEAKTLLHDESRLIGDVSPKGRVTDKAPDNSKPATVKPGIADSGNHPAIVEGFRRDVFDLQRAEKHDGILTQHLRSDERAAAKVASSEVATQSELSHLEDKVADDKKSLNTLASSKGTNSQQFSTAGQTFETDENSQDKLIDHETDLTHKASELGHRSSHLRSDLRHEAKTLLYDESRLIGDVSPKGQVTDKAAGPSKPATVQHGPAESGSRPTTVEPGPASSGSRLATVEPGPASSGSRPATVQHGIADSGSRPATGKLGEADSIEFATVSKPGKNHGHNGFGETPASDPDNVVRHMKADPQEPVTVEPGVAESGSCQATVEGFTRDVFDLQRVEKHDGILTQHLRSDEHAATTAFDEAVATHQSLGKLGSKISHEKQSLNHLGSSDGIDSPAYKSAAGKLNTDEISEDKAADQEQAFDHKASELGHRSSHLRSDLRHEAKTLLHDETRLIGDVSPKGQVTDKAPDNSKPATVKPGIVDSGNHPATVEPGKADSIEFTTVSKPGKNKGHNGFGEKPAAGADNVVAHMKADTQQPVTVEPGKNHGHNGFGDQPAAGAENVVAHMKADVISHRNGHNGFDETPASGAEVIQPQRSDSGNKVQLLDVEPGHNNHHNGLGEGFSDSTGFIMPQKSDHGNPNQLADVEAGDNHGHNGRGEAPSANQAILQHQQSDHGNAVQLADIEAGHNHGHNGIGSNPSTTEEVITPQQHPDAGNQRHLVQVQPGRNHFESSHSKDANGFGDRPSLGDDVNTHQQSDHGNHERLVHDEAGLNNGHNGFGEKPSSNEDVVQHQQSDHGNDGRLAHVEAGRNHGHNGFGEKPSSTDEVIQLPSNEVTLITKGHQMNKCLMVSFSNMIRVTRVSLVKKDMKRAINRSQTTNSTSIPW